MSGGIPHDQLEDFWEAEEAKMFPPLSPEEAEEASKALSAMLEAAKERGASPSLPLLACLPC